MSGLLCPGERRHYPFEQKATRALALICIFEEEKNQLPQPGIKQFLGHPASNPIAY